MSRVSTCFICYTCGNLYCYGGNNPVRYVDPDGKKFVVKNENTVYIWNNEANEFYNEKTKKFFDKFL